MEVQTRGVRIEEMSGVKERQQDIMKRQMRWVERYREGKNIEKTYAVMPNYFITTQSECNKKHKPNSHTTANSNGNINITYIFKIGFCHLPFNLFDCVDVFVFACLGPG